MNQKSESPRFGIRKEIPERITRHCEAFHAAPPEAIVDSGPEQILRRSTRRIKKVMPFV